MVKIPFWSLYWGHYQFGLYILIAVNLVLAILNLQASNMIVGTKMTTTKMQRPN